MFALIAILPNLRTKNYYREGGGYFHDNSMNIYYLRTPQIRL